MVKKLVLYTCILVLLGECDTPDHSSLPVLDLLREPDCGDFLFTAPGDNPQGDKIREKIIRRLDGAKHRIDFWFYGMDEAEIIRALARARSRGVRIFLMGSQDQSYAGLEMEGFRPSLRFKTGLQHVKALLVDKTEFVSGTGNFTKSGIFHNDNAFFFLRISPETGEAITKTLNQENLFHSTIRLPCGGKMIGSPKRGKTIQNTIVQSIMEASLSIDYLIYSFTDPTISASLIHAALRGVRVRGVHDDPVDSSTGFSGEANRIHLALAGTNSVLRLDGNRERFFDDGPFPHGGHMHHKSMVIDGRSVLTGSFNWSVSARDSNMELFYLFDDLSVSAAFQREFDRAFRLGRDVPRPPLASYTSRSLPRYDPESELFFLEAPQKESEQTVTIFSGEGPFFRAISFSLSPGLQFCSKSDRLKASSGLDAFRNPNLSPDTDQQNIALRFAYSDGFSGNQNEGGPVHPCQRERCLPVQVLQAFPQQGWIRLPLSASPSSIQFLSTDGWSPPLPLEDRRDGYFHFSPVERDEAIVFLKGEIGPTGVACIQSGETLDSGLTQFLDQLEWEKELLVACSPAD